MVSMRKQNYVYTWSTTGHAQFTDILGHILYTFTERNLQYHCCLPRETDILVHMAEGQGHTITGKKSLSLTSYPGKPVFGLQVLRFWRSTLMDLFNTRMKPFMELYIWKRATKDCHHEIKSVLTATAVSVAKHVEGPVLHFSTQLFPRLVREMYSLYYSQLQFEKGNY